MPDLTTVTDASPAQATDQIVLLRAGVAYTITIAELQASAFQAVIALSAGALLGRTSGTTGGPQQLAPGSGLAIAGTNLVANGTDHLGLNLLTWMDASADLIVNSAGVPSRLPFAFMAEYLQSSLGAQSDVLLDQNGLPMTDQNGNPLFG